MAFGGFAGHLSVVHRLGRGDALIWRVIGPSDERFPVPAAAAALATPRQAGRARLRSIARR